MTDDGRQVVLAEAEHLNVPHNDHLVVVLIEDGVVQQICVDKEEQRSVSSIR